MTSNYISGKRGASVDQPHESGLEEQSKKREEDDNVRKMGHILKRLNSPRSKGTKPLLRKKESRRSVGGYSYV